MEEADQGFDVEMLADKTAELLMPLPGQVFWIWASVHSLDLIQALAYRIRAQGAFWSLRLIMEPLLRKIGLGVPERFLALVPEHELRWLADISAIVEIHDHGGHVPDVPAARRRAMGTEWRALGDEAARRDIRRVSVVNPTPALAAAYGVPLATLRQRYWQAIAIDHAALDRQQEEWRALLAQARSVHITSPLGTDLRLRIEGRPAHLDRDGLPRGEVYIAPHEDSAEGIAIIDRAFIRGRPVEQLRLTFEAGRLVAMDAPDPVGAEALRELLAASSGDKDVIAEFAIGMNPGVVEPVGDIWLDEKMRGSVHIAIGMNERFGGRNRSNLHLDLVIQRPQLWLDEELVVRAGAL